MKKENLSRVIGQIVNMINANEHGWGLESFKGWCEDGDVFAYNGLSDEDVTECVEIMNKLAPHVDALTDVIYELSEV